MPVRRIRLKVLEAEPEWPNADELILYADADGVHLIDDAGNDVGFGDAGAHSHAGEDITSGTVADARVASTVARDSEVTTAVSNHAAASDPHPTYLTQAEADARYLQPDP